MGAVTTLPWSRPLTRADLETMPDDGHRYELLDGTLLVSPAPSPRHQRAVLGVRDALLVARPAHLRVYVAPLDVVLADDFGAATRRRGCPAGRRDGARPLRARAGRREPVAPYRVRLVPADLVADV